MSRAVSYNLQLAVRDGQLDALRELMAEMVASTGTEPGTLVYEWFLSEDGSTCHTYERFADSDAVLAHLGNFGSKFAERFMACVQPTGLSVYGDPSGPLRAALDDFGAVYLGWFGGFSR
jgi:quinol monooxygenase YgiN